MQVQTKLLRVLEEQKVRPVGATQLIDINVRVVAALEYESDDGCQNGTIQGGPVLPPQRHSHSRPATQSAEVGYPFAGAGFCRAFRRSERDRFR